MRLEPASSEDLAAVQAMLAASALPFEDIASLFDHFIVAREGDRLVGVAGLEVHGTDGLLRSVCVDAAVRGRGIGQRLCDDIEARAAAAGLAALYLLTTTAERFFEGRGYAVIARGAAPAPIRGTAEFRSLCPSTAVCMYKRL